MGQRAMSRVLDIANILELIIDYFHDAAFTQQQLSKGLESFRYNSCDVRGYASGRRSSAVFPARLE
jgi:hypothetical protein